MRRVLAVTALAGLLTGAAGLAASPASAGPKLPDVTDCQSVNDFLGIDNVRDCHDPVS